MYKLLPSLLEHHLIVLRMIGEWWELDLVGLDKDDCAKQIAERLQQLDLAQELQFVEPEESAAMQALIEAGGKIPVATFSRSHGEVRQMGPGKLEREEPWYAPSSPAEALWYRGFLYRGFDETGDGVVEYYFIPEELLGQFGVTAAPVAAKPPVDSAESPKKPAPTKKQKPAAPKKPVADPILEAAAKIKAVSKAQKAPVVIEESVSAEPPPPPPSPTPAQPKTPEAPAPTVEPKPAPEPAPEPAAEPEPVPANPADFVAARDDAVDDVTTILAHAQRNPLNTENIERLRPFLVDTQPSRQTLLITLAHEMGLLRETDEGYRPNRTATEWLNLGRPEQLRQLAEAWSSSNFNELRHMPALLCEGSGWSNDPLLARTALLEALPRETVWSDISDIVADIKASNPDFQRPDGDYDNWYIRDKATSKYLNGFDAWDKIEGRLLHYLMVSPLNWLGLADSAENALRLTPLGLAWLENRPYQAHESDLPLIVQPNSTIIVPQQANRLQRFQVTRIAEPLPLEAGRPYLFRMTPQSLSAAKEAGIEPARVLTFLQKATGSKPIPASARRALERWGERGTEGQLERLVVLRVEDASVLETLRKNERTQAFIGESLGDLAVVVRNGKWQELRQITAQLGLLLDDSGILREDDTPA